MSFVFCFVRSSRHVVLYVMIWRKSTPFFNFFYFFLFYFLYLHLMQFCSVIFLFLTANFWSEMPGFWRRVLHYWDFDGMSWIFFFSNLIFPSFFIQIRQFLLQIHIFIPAWRSLLFIIWKQANLFTDQPDKTTFYINAAYPNAEYLCVR